MRTALAMVLASLALASCGGDAEPTSSAKTTTTALAATTTAVPGPTLDFCGAGEVFLREYENADFASHGDAAELRTFMERGNAITDTLGSEAPLEIQLSIKAVAAVFDKRRSVYALHGYEIGAVTQEERTVIAAVEADAEDSEKRMHDYLVRTCNIAL